RGTAWDADFVPMGWRLAEADPRVKVLELSYSPGQRWACDLAGAGALQCGIVVAEPTPRVAGVAGRTPHIQMFASLSWGFHGLLYVGALTPSMPAASLAGHTPPPQDAVISPLQNKTRQLKFY
ncbi:hypothetical protein KRR26_34905, partial [Corallococcus sp. M34]|nr:hypothetical protein [Citreicoccus inhibens]